MSGPRLASLFIASTLVLAGCSGGIASLWPGILPAPSPSVWYEANPAEITFVDGPATAVAGRPLTLAARIIVGSSSCDRFKELQVQVEEASRSVVLSGWRESKRSNQQFECTDDLGSKLATVSVTLPTAGTYRVVGERFRPVRFGLDETPRATFDLQVQANGAS